MDGALKIEIQKLVAKYEAAVNSGQLKKYTEEDTKKDFILPLFKILGWNVNDRNEVSSEESIKSSGRVDYGFYFNERPKFYLEAKPLRADLHKEEYARQAVRYSWNRGVTWAILTDFESIKVFNAQNVKSSLHDKLFFEISYKEYIERFDQLWLLSKEAFKQDLIDKEAERIGKKLTRVSVSASLYEDLNECRDILTHELAAWNPKINPDLLDEGIQRLLDRLIFIRVAEDRGLEPSTLRSLVNSWKALPSQKRNEVTLYQSMVDTFRKLDKTYDSNLFQPHPFEEWEEHSGATEKVIEKLYGKQGYYEYDFKVIPADVLGTVYENYLGYRLAKARKGITLQKDAKKRKEQGIYYTPPFIVEYIVKHALEPVLKQCKTVADLTKIKILDPACGSGSFLVKALEVLDRRYKEVTAQESTPITKLAFLNQNIYGVDLDSQAVEIAQLNLLLASLDERTKLPILSGNIQNGNSLISGSDEGLKKYFGKDFRDKKPFNWKEEFPQVFERGGFDVIIGNPPYVRPENVEEDERNYFIKSGHFDKFFGRFDIYILFIEWALKALNKNGFLSFIIPSSFFNQNYSKALREWLLRDFKIETIVDLSDIKVFGGATVQSAILVVKNSKPNTTHQISIRKPESIEEFASSVRGGVALQASFLKMPQCMIRTDLNVGYTDIVDKIKSQTIPLSDICYVAIGIVPHDSKTGASKDRLISSTKSIPTQKQYIEGKDIGRYRISWRGIYLDYQPHMMHRPKFPELLENDKLFIRNISTKEGLIAVLDGGHFYANDTVSICVPWYFLKNVKERGVLGSTIQLENSQKYVLRYLLALVNSKLLNFYFKKVLSSNLHVYPEAVRNLPIYRIDFGNAEDVARYKQLSEYAGKMLRLQKDLGSATENSNEWERLGVEVKKTDKKIDEEVYKLYDLTQEEIKVVEDSK